MLPGRERDVVYAFYSPGLQRVKLGVSTNPERRRTQLEGVLGPLKLVWTAPGDRREEAALHRRFAAYRIPGSELFYPSRVLQSFLGDPLLPSLTDEELANDREA
jgi:hypothetical protein